MDFELTAEQKAFAASLDALLASSRTVDAARAWAEGSHGPGLEIWGRLAEQGVNALLVAEEDGGVGGSFVDLAVAHEALGRHLAVGPWIESTAFLAATLSGKEATAIAEGLVASVPIDGYVLDADVATVVGDGCVGDLAESVDITRRLFRCEAPAPGVHATSAGAGFEAACLAASAQLLGSAERVLADTVAYAQQRRQFGRAIGSFQAVKHALADVRIQLDFVRPLIHGAALALDAGGADAARSVSAAKACASDAAVLAARTGLQVHGAVGYTRELDLSLWLLRIQALSTAWGTPAFHRQRVLDSLLGERDVRQGAAR
ncbi:acyl-CoA dehydrogenase [Streptomyces chlorus]|uniref:Acyl-CoA dehydrogenase family protein n=1 Tax=Streptomyces chlorus TaxID=887452 RepID=A0ABW1DZU5_9ACTN